MRLCACVSVCIYISHAHMYCMYVCVYLCAFSPFLTLSRNINSDMGYTDFSQVNISEFFYFSCLPKKLHIF